MDNSTPSPRYRSEGSVYRRKSDGLWVAAFDLAPLDGKRRRRVLTSSTEAGVRAKFEAANAERELKPVRGRQADIRDARRRGTHTRAELVENLRRTTHCRYCRTALNAFNRVQDHIVAVTEGGSDAIDNIQWICWECNFAKGYAAVYAYGGPRPRPFAAAPRRRPLLEKFLRDGGDLADAAAVEAFGRTHFRIR